MARRRRPPVGKRTSTDLQRQAKRRARLAEIEAWNELVEVAREAISATASMMRHKGLDPGPMLEVLDNFDDIENIVRDALWPEEA